LTGHGHEVAFTGYFRGSPATAFGEHQNTATQVLGAGGLNDVFHANA
jgi:hypothetical protein